MRWTELIRKLTREGFRVEHEGARHTQYTHPDGRTVYVPRHPGKEAPTGLANRILRDAGLK